MRKRISYFTSPQRNSVSRQAKIPPAFQSATISTSREPKSRISDSVSVMNNRTRLSGLVLSSLCALVACGSEDSPDGSVRGELRVANISYKDGHSEREFYLATEGEKELTRLVLPKNTDIPALTP